MSFLTIFGIISGLCLIVYLFVMRAYIFDAMKQTMHDIDEPFLDDKDYTYNNKFLIERMDADNICTCLRCKRTFERKNIVLYTDDDSAICPVCGCDSVVHYELIGDDLEKASRSYS